MSMQCGKIAFFGVVKAQMPLVHTSKHLQCWSACLGAFGEYESTQAVLLHSRQQSVAFVARVFSVFGQFEKQVRNLEEQLLISGRAIKCTLKTGQCLLIQTTSTLMINKTFKKFLNQGRKKFFLSLFTRNVSHSFFKLCFEALHMSTNTSHLEKKKHLHQTKNRCAGKLSSPLPHRDTSLSLPTPDLCCQTKWGCQKRLSCRARTSTTPRQSRDQRC
jgi:hypothetical protein